ncbi:hypothetical protein I6F26_33625 [Ensifer sp. IC3342]|nr:hypothetical protein [Ensifer sp. BRP08]MCA1451353.1 hypothetical protein [Ensifer sp. IC3342]
MNDGEIQCRISLLLADGREHPIRLKRTDGLARCTWRGVDHFDTSIWSSVVASNLALFARLRPT